MSKKSTKALASATLMSLVLTTALSAGPVKAAQGPVTRVSGDNRYATASQVATKNWTSGSKDVVLVSGEGYADAVSASALAKKLDAPILLTTSDTLSQDAETALNTLKPKNVYVVGGNASISQSIRDGLKAKYTLTELGGATRYATNVAVAQKLVELGVSASDVMVVGGQGFADALSVAPVAAAKGQILLLANNDQASTQGAIDFVKDKKSNVTVVGTTNVISDAIKDAFGTTAKRVNGGSSRFDTNLDVLKAFSSDLKADKLYVANASAADPDNLYADALVASALAGKYTAPLVLVDKDKTTATDNAVAYIKSENAKDIEVIGGTGVVPDSIIKEITGPTPVIVGDSVSSVESNGLRQIKVVFDGEVDQDTAEDVTNYKVDGTTLQDKKDKAVLQDDDKTVLITLQDKQKQNDDVDVTVKRGILSKDKSVTIKEYNTTVTFKDTTIPTLKSIDAKGNKKLTVQFSEPVVVGKNVNASDVYNKFKINDKNISSFGLNSQYTVAKDAVQDDDGYFWSNKVDFYFDTALPTGNNTLKVSDGEKDELEDAANFPIAETTQDFNVDTLTTTPGIKSIDANDDGKVYINFDRPMDAKTATKYDNYKINDKDLTSSNKVELKKGDTQVKISGVDLNKGANKLYIDDNVKDAYGNNIEEDTYEPFKLEEDTTKPAVNDVYALDDSTIRVKYSKAVDTTYAKNVSNYTLLDGDGTDITTDQIDKITVAGDTDATTADVYDIKLKSGYKLTDSKYTITISNVQDKATTPNVMKSYTNTFDGSSDVNAEVTGVYKVNGDSKKITVVFNKAMDSSALSDVKNYQYTNVKGDTKTLPSSAETDPSSDNKAVTITLPDSLTTDLKSSKDDEYKVKALYATDVKDINGNKLQVGSQGGDIIDATTGAKTKANSLKVYYDGNDLKADVIFDLPIDSGKVIASDFSLGGVTADSATSSGNKVTLTFNSNSDSKTLKTNINTIKAQGVGVKLAIKATSDTKDVTGQSVTTDGSVVPYFYDAAPRTIALRDNTSNPVSNWTATAGTTPVVTAVFDTPIFANSVKASDFSFSIDGTNADANNAEVVKDASGNPTNTVKFTFDTDDSSKFVSGQTVRVLPKDNGDISTLKDGNGDYAYYKPSGDDLKGIKIVIEKADATAALKAAIASAANYKSADYTTDSYKVLSDAVAAANALPATATDDQKETAATAINNAISKLVKATPSTLPVPTDVSVTPSPAPGKTIIVATFDPSVDLTKYVIKINGQDVQISGNKVGATADGIYTKEQAKALVTVTAK
jgi:putative cell wall-binding protein